MTARQVFGRHDDHAADLLNNAASVVSFLSDVAGGMRESLATSGLSDSGVHGFTQILTNLENTIKLAESKL